MKKADLVVRGTPVYLDLVTANDRKRSRGSSFDQQQLAEAVLTGRGHPLPLRAEKWLSDVCADHDASAAVTACTPKQIVGFVRWIEDATSISLMGTFVYPGFRTKGLARLMWEEALDNFDPKKTIEVVMMSPGGLSLVKSIEMAHPDRLWDVEANF